MRIPECAARIGVGAHAGGGVGRLGVSLLGFGFLSLGVGHPAVFVCGSAVLASVAPLSGWDTFAPLCGLVVQSGDSFVQFRGLIKSSAGGDSSLAVALSSFVGSLLCELGIGSGGRLAFFKLASIT